MSLHKDYQNLYKDPSGTLVKNRFKNELYWGIKKIYEMHSENQDYFVIFDNVCDIEVGVTDDKISFFQIKTGKNRCTIQNICKSTPTTKSILAKLYDANSDSTEKMVLVSKNLFKCDNTKLSSSKNIVFNDFSNDEKNILLVHLRSIFNIEDIDLSKIEFLHSEFCIHESDDLLLGATTKFLEAELDIVGIRSTAFLDYLKSIVLQRSTNEYHFSKLEDAIENKGIKRDEIERIIDTYSRTTNNFFQDTSKIIENLSNIGFKEKIRVKKTITEYQNEYDEKPFLKTLVDRILDEINLLPDNLNEEKIIENLYTHITFPDYFKLEDKYAVIIYALVVFVKKGDL